VLPANPAAPSSASAIVGCRCRDAQDRRGAIPAFEPDRGAPAVGPRCRMGTCPLGTDTECDGLRAVAGLGSDSRVALVATEGPTGIAPET